MLTQATLEDKKYFVFEDMPWIAPQHSRTEVVAAGKMLLTPRDKSDFPYPEYFIALDIFGNWRSSHSFPLNNVQTGLRQKTKTIPGAVISQRLKRLESTLLKLRMKPTLTLAAMQDIGGCRAVVGTLSEVRSLHEAYRRSRAKPLLIKTLDYIANPKPSGYRAIHLVYQFRSDQTDKYDDLKVEIQLRTKLQHSWATAVEIVGAFEKQALKSSLGNPEWLTFFKLMADRLELTERPSHKLTGLMTLDKEIVECNRRLNALASLSTYTIIPQWITEKMPGSKYYLLVSDYDKQSTEIAGYGARDLEVAQDNYLKIEKELLGQTGKSAVLVSVDSLKYLQRAYASYFLDATLFLANVKKALGK